MKFINLFIILSICLVSCNSISNPSKDHCPVHDTFNVESDILNEKRVINVWKPEIDFSKGKAIPVLYMLDGGVKEDFPHLAITVAKLIENKQIEPVILVGIENTNRRRDLTGFSDEKDDEQYAPLTDGALKFRNFINSELFPEVQKRYQVSNYKGIIGESLAGLFITETFLKESELFDFYIAIDPSLWWNNHKLIENVETDFNKRLTKSTKYWFAGSDAQDIYLHTRVLNEELSRVNPINLSWTYSDEPKEQHSTIFRAVKEKALIWSLKTKN